MWQTHGMFHVSIIVWGDLADVAGFKASRVKIGLNSYCGHQLLGWVNCQTRFSQLPDQLPHFSCPFASLLLSFLLINMPSHVPFYLLWT